jgi:hypothetical protein
MSCYAMQCILCKIIFGKVFICRVHRYATHMHFYVGKTFILVKSGCYTSGAQRLKKLVCRGWTALPMPLMTMSMTVMTVLHSEEVVHIPQKLQLSLVARHLLI